MMLYMLCPGFLFLFCIGMWLPSFDIRVRIGVALLEKKETKKRKRKREKKKLCK